MVDIVEECRVFRLKKDGHQYIRRPGLSKLAPVLLIICIALSLPTSILGPTNGAYTSVSESGASSREMLTRDNLQSDPIVASDETYVLWDMLHGNQAPSLFSTLIGEIESYGFVINTLWRIISET